MARKPKLDETLAAAHERARTALLEIAPESMIGAHIDAVCDGDRLVTHRFVTLQPGYEGWCWFATLTRIPRAQAKDITVCEVGILPGEDALLAPAWIPWAERVRPEDLEAERLAAEEAAGQGSVGVEEPETHDDADEVAAEGSGDPEEAAIEDGETDRESPEDN